MPMGVWILLAKVGLKIVGNSAGRRPRELTHLDDETGKRHENTTVSFTNESSTNSLAGLPEDPAHTVMASLDRPTM